MKLNSAIEIRTGSDPRQRTEFIQLRDEIQKLTHPARPDINWGKVEQLSLTLFRQHGVELQTAAYYTLARTENLGLIGLEEGLAIIVRLVSQQWSVLWPQPTHARVEILAWLAERLHQVLRTLAIYYADIAVVYRLEALLAELCETLERLELKHLSKLDSLRLFMHNVAKRLEQIDGTELQQTYSSGTTPTSNDQNSAITNPTSTDSVNEQLVYIAKTDDELLFSPTLNVIVPDNVQIIEPSKPELKPGFFSRMRTPILTFIMGILIGGYGLTLAKPYWNAYQLLPLKTAILNSSTLPSSKLTSEQLELMAILPLEKREMILANIQKQHFSQSEVYLTKLNQASPLWLLQQGDTLLRQNEEIFGDIAPVQKQMQTWKTEREENAVSLSELNGYYHAQLQLQDLANKLNELDTKKGKYLTGSELKTAVYSIQQPLTQSPPLEELLRQLAIQSNEKQDIDPALIKQIELKFTQLSNRYYLLTR